MYAFVKIRQTHTLRFMHFIVQKIFIKEINLNNTESELVLWILMYLLEVFWFLQGTFIASKIRWINMC